MAEAIHLQYPFQDKYEYEYLREMLILIVISKGGGGRGSKYLTHIYGDYNND